MYLQQTGYRDRSSKLVLCYLFLRGDGLEFGNVRRFDQSALLGQRNATTMVTKITAMMFMLVVCGNLWF